MACKDCKHCEKKGLFIYPLRYAVSVAGPRLDETATQKARASNPNTPPVIRPSNALSSVPALPSKLGAGVKDIALGPLAKYSVRVLRNGFLYALIERDGIKTWQGYAVLESTQLFQFDIESPPTKLPEALCSSDGKLMHSYMVAINDAEKVPNAWFLFSPRALTARTLSEFKKNPAAGNMQHFSPAAWVGGSTNQPHTLLSSELQQNVIEHILYCQQSNALFSPLGEASKMQLFAAPSAAYAGTPPDAKGEYGGTLGRIYTTLKRNGGASIALFDHIGITQELNDFRNAALLPVQAFLARRDGEAENQRRLDVMQAIEDVKGGFKSHVVKLNAQRIANVDAANLPNHMAGTAKALRAQGRIAEAEKVEADIRRHEEAKARNRQRMLDGTDAEKEWNRVYAPLLDQGEMDNFRNMLELLSTHCGEQANERADDHMKWLTSARLVEAFDIFDPTDESSGFEFASEHMHCTHGMFGVEKNHVKLTEWMNVDKVQRTNLYMRANLYNHADLLKQADATFAAVRQEAKAAQGVDNIPYDKLAKLTKGLVDAFKKSDSAWDEWLRDDVVRELQEKNVDNTKGTPTYNNNQAKLKGQDAQLRQYRARMDKLSQFHSSREGVALARMGEWTRAVSSKAGKSDHGIVAVVGLIMYSKLRELAEKIGMGEFFLKLNAEKMASIRAATERAVAQGLITPQQGEQHIKNSEPHAADSARRHVRAEANRTQGSLSELIRDEQKKLGERLVLTQEELSKGQRPPTNNFHQARLGVLLMSLEGLSLTLLVQKHKGEFWSRDTAEITASVLSLSSIVCDTIYASAKSLREVNFDRATAPNLNAAAEIYRGGFKIVAGSLSTVAGVFSVCLDFQTVIHERQKENRNLVLLGIYSTKIGVGAFNAGFGFVAALSYTGPMLRYLGYSGKITIAAERYALSRTLWLIRVARFNWIGLAITAIEVGYTWFIKDDALETWCKTGIFRKNKKTNGVFAKTPFSTTKQELEALDGAFRLITGQASEGQLKKEAEARKEPALK